jgi:methenyltetrahydromethanopterin cyclohydrolase
LLSNLTLNERAQGVANQLAANSEEHRVSVHHTTGGARIIDCGVQSPGGLKAGVALARTALSDLADVNLVPGDIGGTPCVQVTVASDNPVAACMASQYAGWQISVGKYFAMGSGPMRAAYGKEELFNKIPGREHAPVAVGTLESRKLPDDAVVNYLAEKLNLAPSKITLLVAPAFSIAGSLQVVARSLETALHKLSELQFDLTQVASGFGCAPLPPGSVGDLQAIGRTNDAILYGGRVILWVRSDDERLRELGLKVPSCASPDHGAPFSAIFDRYGQDFYKIDPLLFSPAEVVFYNLKTGNSYTFGRLEPEILNESFYGKP